MSLIRANARYLPLVGGCVQTCITSPPYFRLRAYPDARQIGLEPSVGAYVDSLVVACAEIWRVLRDDGSLWLILGDTFDTGKNLLGVPWRVALALRDAGWRLRSDIIWAKPNPLPEPVTDRPTRAHEYVFLLTKHDRYYYDAAAIRETCSEDMQRRAARGHTRGADGKVDQSRHDAHSLRGAHAKVIDVSNGRNNRDVWSVPVQSYAGAHFATFPEALITPCILAGSRFGDVVLDPFGGTGTTAAVATRYGRRGVVVDLSYQALAKIRTAQRGLPFSYA